MRFNFDHCGIMQTDCFCALQLYGNWIFANKVSAFSARVAEKNKGVDGILPSEAQSGIEVLGRERSLFAKYT